MIELEPSQTHPPSPTTRLSQRACPPKQLNMRQQSKMRFQHAKPNKSNNTRQHLTLLQNTGSQARKTRQNLTAAKNAGFPRTKNPKNPTPLSESAPTHHALRITHYAFDSRKRELYNHSSTYDVGAGARSP